MAPEEMRKMSNTYNPDKWIVVKIDDGRDPHYRILGSWSGGYLDGDSWRMNSGITRVEADGDHLMFYGSSGSCYAAHKEMWGTNMAGQGAYNKYKTGLGAAFNIVDENTDWENHDWIIT
jgi:hypothetical protein